MLTTHVDVVLLYMFMCILPVQVKSLALKLAEMSAFVARRQAEDELLQQKTQDVFQLLTRCMGLMSASHGACWNVWLQAARKKNYE